jgi:hypothetical protein
MNAERPGQEPAHGQAGGRKAEAGDAPAAALGAGAEAFVAKEDLELDRL